MMNYKQQLNKTVQWNTHDLSGGVPVFGLDTKQPFRPSPTDNIADQGGFNQTLGLDQISAIITQDIIPRLTKIQTQYPQDPFSASAKSDTDIWNHINQYIWGKSGAESSPRGDWAANPNAPIPMIAKNRASIESMKTQHKNFQDQLNAAKDERDSIQEKIEGKAMRNHTHANYSLRTHTHSTGGGADDGGGGDDEDCGWFGEKCWGKNIGGSLLPSISMTTIAAVGVGAYFLMRKK